MGYFAEFSKLCQKVWGYLRPLLIPIPLIIVILLVGTYLLREAEAYTLPDREFYPIYLGVLFSLYVILFLLLKKKELEDMDLAGSFFIGSVMTVWLSWKIPYLWFSVSSSRYIYKAAEMQYFQLAYLLSIPFFVALFWLSFSKRPHFTPSVIAVGALIIMLTYVFGSGIGYMSCDNWPTDAERDRCYYDNGYVAGNIGSCEHIVHQIPREICLQRFGGENPSICDGLLYRETYEACIESQDNVRNRYTSSVITSFSRNFNRLFFVRPWIIGYPSDWSYGSMFEEEYTPRERE